MTGFVSTPVGTNELLDAVVRCLNVNPSGTFSAVTASAPAAPPEPPRVAAPPSNELETAQALGRLGGNRHLYQRLLRRFTTTHGNSAREVQRCLSKGSFDEAAMIVHTLSSAAANIGAPSLKAAAEGLENALRRRQLDSIARLLADFELTDQATQAAVANALDVEPPSSNGSERKNDHTVAEVLARFRAQLDDNDTAAVDSLDELRVLFTGQASAAEALQRLEASVSAYDFSQARSHLDTLETWFSPRTTEGEVGS
jgi:HPt (histidine-containing phosphotransfer) domain-containing protein